MDKKLENCSSIELCDLLASKTLKLLDAINKKADSLILNGYRKEVEAIQKIIEERRRSDKLADGQKKRSAGDGTLVEKNDGMSL